MKLTLFTLEFPPQTGGVAKYYGTLAKHYAPAGAFSVILAQTQSGIGKYLSYFQQLNRAYHEGERNFVAGQVLPLGTALYLYSKMKRIKYSVFFHGLDFSLATRNCWKRRLTKKILLSAHKIICANSYTQQEVVEFLGQRREVFLVNPGVDAPTNEAEIENTWQILEEKYQLKNQSIIFSLGRLVERKGFDTLVKVFHRLNQDNTLLAIAGSGPEEERLKELAKDNPRIIFLGKISETEKWAWLKNCTLFALLSREIKGDYEGFGIVYLEANLMGKPVLAGRTGGVADAVLDRRTGILVDGENNDNILLALKELLEDSKLRDELGAKGKERAMVDFSGASQAQKIQAILSL